jgi:Domain of unknown function (DUF4159)
MTWMRLLGRARMSIPGLVLLGVVLAGAVWAAQMPMPMPVPFRQYPDYERNPMPLPPDYQESGEWVFARLMYPPAPVNYQYGPNRDWLEGNTSWTIDYPRADRRIAAAVRRLTRVRAKSVEQPVNLDDADDVYFYPYLYAVEVGSWGLTDSQARKLRDFLLRGGFLMVDDFHGTTEWNTFIASMGRVFPDRPITEISKDNPIFHTLFDITEFNQVPGLQFVYSGRTYEHDGYVPHWRGIYDDHGRVMVAICYNMDLGDALEHSDNPLYPQNYSEQGIHFFLNYLIYSMTN